MRHAHFLLWALVATAAPNILFIVSEDNGPELGCYGEPTVRTPVLDRLAEQGVRFDRAFVPQAGCSQSRAAYLTGLYPHQNGQIGLATWKFRMYRADTPNLVRSLKEAGYRTGIIGKLHINPASAFPFDFKAIPSSNFGRRGLAEYAKKASNFITAGDEPFFLSVNYPDPHRPFIAKVGGLPREPHKSVKPLAYMGVDTPALRAETADYYNCMERLNSLIGDLLAVLDASGKASDTLVIYIGDHGADMLRGKRTSYEGGLRVPFIVKWPGQTKPQVRQELVSTLDIMPTLIAASGASPVPKLPGRDLAPLLRGESPSWRQYLHSEFHLHSAHNFYPQRAVRDQRFKLIHNLMPGERNPGADFTLDRFYADSRAVIDSHPAYQRMQQPPEFELYDLESDPYEFANIANSSAHADTLARLQSELRRWRQATADPLLKPENLRRLKAEVDACFKNGKPDKSRLTLTYPDYFGK